VAVPASCIDPLRKGATRDSSRSDRSPGRGPVRKAVAWLEASPPPACPWSSAAAAPSEPSRPRPGSPRRREARSPGLRTSTPLPKATIVIVAVTPRRLQARVPHPPRGHAQRLQVRTPRRQQHRGLAHVRRHTPRQGMPHRLAGHWRVTVGSFGLQPRLAVSVNEGKDFGQARTQVPPTIGTTSTSPALSQPMDPQATCTSNSRGADRVGHQPACEVVESTSDQRGK
jgi:hypothetical protein